MKKPSIKSRLDDLAHALFDDAAKSDDPKFRLDSFKALSQHFVGTTRVQRHMPQEEDEASILSLKEKIKGHMGGTAIHERH